ncbi:MAG: Lon protease family protein [Verrucomicrobiota bacterium]|jgi:lon-related putative ATP-dependent protease
MSRVTPLKPNQLANRCALKDLSFRTTKDLKPVQNVIGQDRAVEALKFGVEIGSEGYNLFVLGPSGYGRHSVVQDYLNRLAKNKPVPSDWCYVNNFIDSYKPRLLKLPAGRGRKLAEDMERLVEDLRNSIPAAFENDKYRMRRQEIEHEVSEQQDKALDAVKKRAKKRSITLIQTPSGIALSPTLDGEILDQDSFRKLPEKDRKRIQKDITTLQADIEKIIHQIPRIRRSIQRKVKELNRAVTKAAVLGLVEDLRHEYADLENVQDYLNKVLEDVVEYAEDLFLSKEGPGQGPGNMPTEEMQAASMVRYRVNVLVDHGATKGTPVLYEDNPCYNNLLGRVEHVSHMGTLLTDFTLIKPGMLHLANGGYLVIDAMQVLMQPFAWDSLKRCLRSREIRIESLGQSLSLVSTVSLEPEPLPLDIKVVLVGDRMLYYMLHELDPEFSKFFKVAVDFEDQMDRSPKNVMLYARLIATLVRKAALMHFDKGAVARVIEFSSRHAEDAEKLTMEIRSIADLLEESNYWAKQGASKVVKAEHVEKAMVQATQRLSRIQTRWREETLRGTFIIDTDGEKVGQINGLSVIQLGGHAFGHPGRITAQVRMGGGEVIDIEREVNLGGSLHSKGMMILSGYLMGHFVSDKPLSLSASIVFEQSYNGVDGDSASSTELYALLSALSGLPIKQSLAVTGALSQMGEVQAIGGVNEKIEGFFELCKARGLTGDQGVLIPAANVKHLMLHPEIVEAVKQKQFHIYPINHVDEGIAILTGVNAGKRNANGKFPKNSVNGRVEQRLVQFAEQSRAFHANDGKDEKK